MSKVNRREFIKLSGTAALSAAAVGASAGSASASTMKAKNVKGTKTVYSYCDVCFMTCGIKVTVEDGVAKKLEGNPNHPISNGMLCPRGTAGLYQLYDSDRIKTPLMRTTVMGRPAFKPVSWETALDFIGKKTRNIIDEYGPQSMSLMKHGKGAAPFINLWHAIESKTEGHPSYAQCRGARDLGWNLTFGRTVGGTETIALDKAKCVAFIGAHLGENMHNVTVQDFTTGLRNGAKNIVVDPRFSTAASKAKYWLPIKPGTDIALLMAWAHVLIWEDRYDKDFIGKYAQGFDELKEHVKDMTPQWAAAYTGLKEEDIRATAIELADNMGESLVFPGRRYAWYGDDTQRARAVAIVNALLGAWGKDTAIFLPDRIKIPKYSKAHKPTGDAECAINSKLKYPLTSSAPPAQDLVEASIPGRFVPEEYGEDEAPIKGWYVYSTNLPMSLPDLKTFEEAANAVELLVVVETMPTEITGYADVILPDTTYLERYDGLNAPPWREPHLAIRQPVVDPLYDSKPAWWIAKEIAVRVLGEEAAHHAFNYHDFEEVIEDQLNQMGSSIADINAKGGVLKKEYKKPKMTFGTPSKKVELYCDLLDKIGQDPMPKFIPPTEPPAGYFRMLTGRAPQHTFTRTTNNPVLGGELYKENSVWVNPEIAKLYGLENGTYVRLKNQDNALSRPIQVRVTERIRQDCVYMVHGFGREDRRLTRTFGKGASDSYLSTKYVADPIMGSTGVNVNFVTFVK